MLAPWKGSYDKPSSVQLLSHVWLFATPWTAACQASLSITNSRTLLKLMSTKLVMPSNPLILCHPLVLLPSIFPSIRIFSNESDLHIRWPKYWSFSFNISPSNEYSGLIPFRMDWLDVLAVQGTLKSLLQHHSSKASILWRSAFLIVQLSHPYVTTGNAIALTRRIVVGKEMSLLFNKLSRLVITFIPRSKHLLISWLQSPSAVILEPKKIKSVTVSTVSPSICHEVIGPDDKPRQHIKKQRHHFANKGLYSQSYGFSSSHVQIWELDIKEAECQRINVFKLWYWRRLLRVPWTARRSHQSNPKGNQPCILIGRTDTKAEAPILWPPDAKNWLTGKDPDAGKDWGQEEKGETEDEMVRWHHQLYGHEFAQTPGDSEG